MINKTVRAVAAVLGVGLALHGAHESAHCSGEYSGGVGVVVVGGVVGLCSGGAHEPRGEGTTPLPPSPFLAPTTFYTSTCCSYFSNALSAPPDTQARTSTTTSAAFKQCEIL